MLATRRCASHTGFGCVFTGRRHFQLIGRALSGAPWTRTAQDYPRKLSIALAQTFDNALLAAKAERFEILRPTHPYSL